MWSFDDQYLIIKIRSRAKALCYVALKMIKNMKLFKKERCNITYNLSTHTHTQCFSLTYNKKKKKTELHLFYVISWNF